MAEQEAAASESVVAGREAAWPARLPQGARGPAADDARDEWRVTDAPAPVDACIPGPDCCTEPNAEASDGLAWYGAACTLSVVPQRHV